MVVGLGLAFFLMEPTWLSFLPLLAVSWVFWISDRMFSLVNDSFLVE
jgi:hypothetical protein